jgi:hypothetical protein
MARSWSIQEVISWQKAGSFRMSPFHNVGIKRTRGGRAPGKLVDVKADKEQSNGGEEKAEPGSITGADKDQSQNGGRSGGWGDHGNRLSEDFRVREVVFLEMVRDF